MSGTTEDQILNNIPGIDDASGDTGADTGGAGAADNTRSGTGGDGRTSSAEPSGTQTSNTNEVRRRHDGLIERPNADDPRTRDLVDPRTGRTVARGGVERSVFEEGQRHARENQTLKQQIQALQSHVGTATEVSRVANEMQLSPDNQVIALRVMGDFLKDPVRTLQSLVEEVKSKGYTIPFLTEGVNPGMDLAAIQRMIDAKMAPITQAQQRDQQQQAERARVSQQLDQFLVDNPDANTNLGVLAQMMQAQPNLTLHNAYTNMIKWCYQHGFDYAQPLQEQVDAHNARAASGQQQTTQQPGRPLPNGRSTSQGAAPMNNGAAFNENTPWSDIIRHSMEESGMSFR